MPSLRIHKRLSPFVLMDYVFVTIICARVRERAEECVEPRKLFEHVNLHVRSLGRDTIRSRSPLDCDPSHRILCDHANACSQPVPTTKFTDYWSLLLVLSTGAYGAAQGITPGQLLMEPQPIGALRAWAALRRSRLLVLSVVLFVTHASSCVKKLPSRILAACPSIPEKVRRE